MFRVIAGTMTAVEKYETRSFAIVQQKRKLFSK